MLNSLLVFEKVKKGDIRAFEMLFKGYYAPLCKYAVKYVERLEVAEEIVQDIFYTLWKNREEIVLTTSVKPYLYKAVLNKSLQHIEHLQVKKKYCDTLLEKGTNDSFPNPLGLMEYNQLEQHIAEALTKLPERRRKIFCMSRFEGLKYSEIAVELSISVKTVEAEISKVIRVLKNSVKGYAD